MKARIERKTADIISSDTRGLYAEEIPAEQFREIDILLSPGGLMPAEVREAIRPCLSEVSSVDFTGGGEPLLHPRLGEWMAEASSCGCETAGSW